MQKQCYKKSANFLLPPNFPLLNIVDVKSKNVMVLVMDKFVFCIFDLNSVFGNKHKKYKLKYKISYIVSYEQLLNPLSQSQKWIESMNNKSVEK